MNPCGADAQGSDVEFLADGIEIAPERPRNYHQSSVNPYSLELSVNGGLHCRGRGGKVLEGDTHL
jgi:hypothetical protein